jgi:hypothetical protein
MSFPLAVRARAERRSRTTMSDTWNIGRSSPLSRDKFENASPPTRDEGIGSIAIAYQAGSFRASRRGSFLASAKANR